MTDRFQPERSRRIPYVRFWKIALRTAHILAASFLVGGHAFGAQASQLRPMLYLAMTTGAGMIFLEAYPTTLAFVFEGWAVLLLGKLALLCLIPFAWGYRLPILIAVIALASIGSHMPGRMRHYSLLYRRVVKE